MRKHWYSISAGLALGVAAPPSLAQVRLGEPLRLPAFDSGVASGTTTDAIAANPANLGFLPASELRLTSSFLDDRSLETAQGHAIATGFRVPLADLATGLRLDLVDPPAVAARRSFGLNANYQWLTWAVAYRPSAAFALGASLQGSWSSNERLDGHQSWTLGATLRPSDHLAFGFVAQDLSRSKRASGPEVNPAYHAALALRPLGRSRFAIELGGAFVDGGPGYWIPRAGVGVDVPSVGRLSGEVLMVDPAEQAGTRQWLAGLKLGLRFNDSGWSGELALGSAAGTALGPDAEWSAHQNVTTSAALRRFRERPGVAFSDYALRIRLEDGASVRGQVALLRRLWTIAVHEPEVKAVVLQIRAAAAGSLAHIEELRDALALLRSRGKKVLCQLEDAGGATLFLCSAADRIVVHPAGRIRFAGLSTRYFYVPRLLAQLGIRAEYARIGAHKSAPEMFSHERASDVARADHIDLLQQFERQMVGSLAAARGMSGTNLRLELAKGPLSAEAAQQAGLVDRLAHDDQIEKEISALLGREIPLREQRAPVVPERHGRGRSVALIYVDGDMIDGRSRNIPLLGVKLAGSYTIAEAIRSASSNSGVGAIVLRVETPGGSALAADVIWRQLVLAGRRKPVIVSIGSVGASAGYYVASAGKRIYANPLTVTGSIGVFAGKVDASELLRKIGVSLETYKTAPRADADSLFRSLTPDEMRELERKVHQFYDVFLDRVSQGRTAAGTPLGKGDVDTVGQGRVWTGEQAVSRRLVDELGGLRQALAEAQRLADLPEDAPLVELPEETGNFILRMLGVAAVPSPTTALPALAAPLDDLARSLAPVTIHPQQWPLLRMEFVTVE